MGRAAWGTTLILQTLRCLLATTKTVVDKKEDLRIKSEAVTTVALKTLSLNPYTPLKPLKLKQKTSLSSPASSPFFIKS